MTDQDHIKQFWADVFIASLITNGAIDTRIATLTAHEATELFEDFLEDEHAKNKQNEELNQKNN